MRCEAGGLAFGDASALPAAMACPTDERRSGIRSQGAPTRPKSSLLDLERFRRRSLLPSTSGEAGGEELDDRFVVGLLVLGVQTGQDGGLQLQQILPPLRPLRQGGVQRLLLQIPV